MKLFTKLFLATFITALPVINVVAVIPQAFIYTNKETGQILIRLDDCHLDYFGGKHTAAEQTTIIEWAKKLGAAIMVENQNSPPGPSKTDFICLCNIDCYYNTHHFQSTCTFSSMWKLVQRCQTRNIEAINIDERPLTAGIIDIKGITDGDTELIEGCKEVLEICDRTAINIQSWIRNGEPSHKLYTSYIDHYHSHPLLHMLGALITHNVDAFVKIINTAMLYPIIHIPEIYQLHTLYMWKSKPIVIMFAGLLHNEDLEDSLPGLGYHQVHHFGLPAQSPTDATNTITYWTIPPVDLNAVFTKAQELLQEQQNPPSPRLRRAGPVRAASAGEPKTVATPPLIRARL